MLKDFLKIVVTVLLTKEMKVTLYTSLHLAKSLFECLLQSKYTRINVFSRAALGAKV